MGDLSIDPLMRGPFTHWGSAESRLLGLVLATLFAMGGYLWAGLQQPERAGVGWRRIDASAVRRLLDSGDLSRREADWYHRSAPGRGAEAILGR